MTAPTLTEFLLARIAEDEAVAESAGGDAWKQGERRHETNVVRPAAGFDWVGVSGDRLDIPVLSAQISNTSRALFEGRASHIARHDPAHVLAECEAKRRIVELHPLRRFIPTPNTWDARDACPTCHGHGHPCDTLRHLAAVYSDHPDYDEAWRA